MPALAVILFLTLVPLLVAATGSTDPLSDLVAAARDGDGRVIAAALLVLTVTALRDFRNDIKWFSGDRGGVLFLFLMSFLGALGTSLVAGAPIDGTLVISALQVGLLAGGGYTAVKRLVAPKGVPTAVATDAGVRTETDVSPTGPSTSDTEPSSPSSKDTV